MSVFHYNLARIGKHVNKNHPNLLCAVLDVRVAARSRAVTRRRAEEEEEPQQFLKKKKSRLRSVRRCSCSAAEQSCSFLLPAMIDRASRGLNGHVRALLS